MTDPQPIPARRSRGVTFYVLLGLIAAVCIGLFIYREAEIYRKIAAEAAQMLQGLESAKGAFFALDSKGTSRVGPPAEGYFHGWKVVSEQPLKSGALEKLLGSLASGDSYGRESAHCFEPGMGLRLQTGARTLDLVVCLYCRKYIAHDGPVVRSWNLSRTGCDRLESIYQAHVP